MSTTLEPPFRSSRYTTGAVVLHWTIAILIVLQIAGGFLMTDVLRNGSSLQFNAYQLHKSLGIAVLVLTIARILWRAFNPPPPEPGSVGRLEGMAAHAVHMTFYALLILIPLSGWLMVTVSPVQIETVLFFQDWLPWPHLPGFAGLTPDAREEITHLTEWVHAVLAYGMGLLVALHVAGAVKHHMADRVYIARMGLGGPGDGPRNSYGHATTWLATLVFAGAMVAAATVARTPQTEDLAAEGVSPDQAAVLAGAAGQADTETAQQDAATAPQAVSTAAGAAGAEAAADSASAGATEEKSGPAPLWTIDPAESEVSFAFTFQGQEVTGRFADFDTEVRFDPDNLEGSSIRVTIPTPSANLNSDAVTESQLSGPDGFADDAHGRATFTADTIRSEDDGYVADGTVTLRGETVPVALPFSVDIDEDAATASGSVTLDRLDFGIGEENDPSGDWLSREVRVNIAIAATRAGAPAASQTAASQTAASQAAATSEEPELAPEWVMLPDGSAVTFSFGFQGATVEGAIDAFAADIRFDPENLAGSSIYVSLDLDTASVEGKSITPTQLRGSDGFAVGEERFARFRADTIQEVGDNAYEAEGSLELRGERVPVTLPFTLFIVEGRAVAEGSVTLDRLAFGIGEENDPEGSMISPEVTVDVRVTAISDEARPDFSR